MSAGRCESCGEHTVLLPLHGGKGGPLRCPLCVGKWNAEHGRRRRTGRIVIRAIQAFYNAGGSPKDIDKLKHTAVMISLGVEATDAWLDPLGYMDGIARLGGADADMTSELLADVLKLTHPDHHPPERQRLAHSVTQQLLALQPFIFPAPKPKPSLRECYGSSTNSARIETVVTKGPTYPCADCKSTIPKNYCRACRSEFEKRLAEKNERERAKQRQQYAKRKARRYKSKACESCGVTFTVSGGSGKHKRADARFCSNACRQRAHRKTVTGSAPESSRRTDAPAARQRADAVQTAPAECLVKWRLGGAPPPRPSRR